MKNVRRGVEDAFAGLLNANTVALNGAVAKVARIPQEMVLPLVLVSCESAKAYSPTLPLYECAVSVTIMTSIADTDADETHQNRLSAISEMLEDAETFASGVTNQQIQCEGVHIDEFTGEPADNMLIDTIKVKAYCQLI